MIEQTKLVSSMLSRDPSGRELWLLESDLRETQASLAKLAGSLGYLHMGVKAELGYNEATQLHATVGLLLREIEDFRRAVELPSGYLPRWDYARRDGCLNCTNSVQEDKSLCAEHSAELRRGVGDGK